MKTHHEKSDKDRKVSQREMLKTKIMLSFCNFQIKWALRKEKTHSNLMVLGETGLEI